MKNVFRTLLVMLALFSFLPTKAQEDSVVVVKKPKFTSDTLFTIMSAERILGQSAFMHERRSVKSGTNRLYQSGYTAFQKDNGVNGSVYYLLEQYNDELSAHQYYIDTRNANAKNGIKVLTYVGSEAYFQSDNGHFYFIMIRKGNKVFNMKVNKITSHTSLAEFNKVAREIAEAL